MRRIGFVLPALVLASAVLAYGADLRVGSPAPAIKVGAWVKGSPLKQFSKGKIYVVEFWATWCGPCRESIPHLTEMAKKYKGKVTFNGISVWEHGDDIPGQVAKFVKAMGDKMAYNVAYDDASATMAGSWMKAAGQNGIPTAFVIGKQGTVEWIGHPMGGLDEVLDKVVAGNFDAQAAAAEREKQEAEQAKLQELMKPFVAAAQNQDWKGAVDALDKVIASNPEMEKGLAPTKVTILISAGMEDQAFAYAKQAAEGVLKDNAMALNEVAWTLVDDKTPLKTRNYDVALPIALRAVEVSKEGDPAILDTLAYTYFKQGKTDMAISTQEKAVKLLDKVQAPQQTKDEITQHLATFKAAKKV